MGWKMKVLKSYNPVLISENNVLIMPWNTFANVLYHYTDLKKNK